MKYQYVVFAFVDKNGLVLDINSSEFLKNTDWIEIDVGDGEKYRDAQQKYLEGGILTMDGIPRYKLADSKPVLRSEEEIAADRDAPPAPPPSRVEVLEAEVSRLRAQNELQAQHQTFLEDCLLEMGNIVYA